MPRSPLAVLRAPQHSCPSAHPPHPSSTRGKRVTFESDALLRAEKHEKRPSTQKMSQFSETVDLESASAWDKFYLARLGVEFDRNQHTELKTLIVDSKWYDPGTETTTMDFAKRIPSYVPLLMEGYFRIIEASKSISEEDLRNARRDQGVQVKLDANPLKLVLLNLVDLLETNSEESYERERKKVKTTTYIPSSELYPAVSESTSERPVTPQFSQPRLPSSFETPDTSKRKTSETSFGTKSTETTPHKLDHPEAKVQSLQDKFVTTIITDLWWGQVNIPWAQGRHLFLTYTETNRTSFQYSKLNPDGGTVIGRVKAVADGALILKTNKAKDNTRYCVWSKQRCAVSFEAKKVNQKWLALDEISGVEPSVTISEARAGQILAEMLGMVCHPEYIASGNSQTGIVVHFDGLHASIYFATFSSSYLSTLRNQNIDLLPTLPHVHLHHTRRYNLLHPLDRTEFIREFVALVRFVAAGEANIGHLRNDSKAIHRTVTEETGVEGDGGETVVRPPQQDLDAKEEEIWRNLHAGHYAA